MADTTRADLVVVQATPAGIAAALAAARQGSRVALTESTAHLGGLMSNGLGVTDIATRGSIGGIFQEFVRRVRAHYVEAYGVDSPQVKECSDGYHFEPHVAQHVFDGLVAAEPRITLWKRHRLERVEKDGPRLTVVTVRDLETGAERRLEAPAFIDATYEGDLAALAGVPSRLGREARKETAEPYAGVLYMSYRTKEVYAGTTGEADARIQAFNYRLCLTDRPELRVYPERPAAYRREDYTSLLRDIRRGYLHHFAPTAGDPVAVFNVIRVPNGKSDTNNHHNGLLSTDLPEENNDYPTASHAERERFLQRQRDYILGLLWFCQNDAELPAAFRAEARRWGLARDEYTDNGYFPRQVYVREARRIEGEYTFSALDCSLAPDAERARIHPDTVTAAHYQIDSHATRKREDSGEHEGRDCLEGFLGIGFLTVPYDVPYGVMVPKQVEGLVVPVACSATHMGFGTLRMEPCWMALGQAAGTAAHLAREKGVTPRKVPIPALQRRLLRDGAVLAYFRDLPATHPASHAVQYWAARGFFATYDARPDGALTRGQAAVWLARALGLMEGKAHRGDVEGAVSNRFADVRAGYPAAGAIAALTRQGVLEGDQPRDEFRPAEALTWAELDGWLHRGYGVRLESLGFKRPGERPYVLRGEFCTLLFDAEARGSS
jgi:hypothetical protein